MRPRTALTTLLVLAASRCGMPQTTAGSVAPPLVPLAYVRRVAIPPIALATPADPALPAAPPASRRAALRRWQERVKVRDAFALLRVYACAEAASAAAARTAALRGIDLIPLPQSASTPPWPALGTAAPGTPMSRVAARSLSLLARDAGADAALAIAVDRFGTHAGVDRQVWIRLVAWVVLSEVGNVRGPLRAFGWARAGPNLLRRGYRADDRDLVRSACDAAARQLVHVLATGEESPFAGGLRFATVPADLPSAATKSPADGDATSLVRLPSLIRQSDVLFQPEAGPVADAADPSRVQEALVALELGPRDLWRADGQPDVGRAVVVARHLGAGYVFLSRARGASLEETPIAVRVGTEQRPGVERRANVEVQAVLVRTADGALLWSQDATGLAVARTEFVREQARIRSDEQCVCDAARTAYAHLNAGLAQFRGSFDR